MTELKIDCVSVPTCISRKMESHLVWIPQTTFYSKCSTHLAQNHDLRAKCQRLIVDFLHRLLLTMPNLLSQILSSSFLFRVTKRLQTYGPGPLLLNQKFLI